MPAEKLRKTCFVIMGLGKKTDFATGRTLDLEKTYRNIIKPAVMDAGLECVRVDEIVHSGLIDLPMYERLLTADVVVADLSTATANVMYELGVRHTMRPYTTIVIAEDNLYSVPFDVTAVKIRRYKHLGDDIGYSEVVRFRRELTEAIVEATSGDSPPAPDSPVYMFLRELTPPTMSGTAALAGDKGETRGGDVAPVDDAISSRLRQADEAQKKGDFLTAKSLLTYVRGAMKTEDPYITQRLALVTYKSKHPTPQAALEEALELLKTLDPATSVDTETLGLWGAVHKRLWDVTGDIRHLHEAVRGYERGFYLRNDSYSGINLAYLLNLRSAASSTRADVIADFVLAERIRRKVLSICELELDHEKLSGEDRYWVLATMAEAYLGVGDEASAQQKFQEAASLAPASWMRDSTQEQMDKLRSLLADSPLESL